MSIAVRALGVFAKEPRPGLVKTRLATAAAPEWAARAADAFLRDTLLRMLDIAAHRFLAFSPAAAAAYFHAVAGDGYRPVNQGDGSLGQRLRHFFADRFAGGFRQVVSIAADSPTLPLDHVEQAFAELDRADIVLGPATDGGYYLLGLARPQNDIFDNIDWGSARVLEQTVARLGDNCRLAVLPPWYDVDTPEDWQALRGHIAALRRAGCDPHVPHTEQLMEGCVH